MVVECFAIILVLLILSYMFMRSGKVATAVSVLPLTVVPIAYLVSKPMASVLARWLTQMTISEIRISIVIVGLIITGIILGSISVKISKKMLRRGYLWLCGSFTIIISVIMIVKILNI